MWIAVLCPWGDLSPSAVFMAVEAIRPSIELLGLFTSYNERCLWFIRKPSSTEFGYFQIQVEPPVQFQINDKRGHGTSVCCKHPMGCACTLSCYHSFTLDARYRSRVTPSICRAQTGRTNSVVLIFFSFPKQKWG